MFSYERTVGHVAQSPCRIGVSNQGFTSIASRSPTSSTPAISFTGCAQSRQYFERLGETAAHRQQKSPRHRLAELEIPLPPLPEQRRIAEVLDRAEALRAKRRAALAQLDTLTQSIFLDMFGDPATNPKRWPSRALQTASTIASTASEHECELRRGRIRTFRLKDDLDGRLETSRCQASQQFADVTEQPDATT